RVSPAGRHEVGVEINAGPRGVKGRAVPRLRVAPTEPYRCGANLPAAPAGVKAARRALAWGLGPAHRYEQRRDQPPETTRDDAHYGTPAHSAPPAPRLGRGAGALGPAARPTQNGSRAGHRRQSDLRSADGRPGLLVRRARYAGGRDVQVSECHPRAERVRGRTRLRWECPRVGGVRGQVQAVDRAWIGHRLYPAG